MSNTIRPIPIFQPKDKFFIYLKKETDLLAHSDRYINFFSKDKNAFFIIAESQTMITKNSLKIEKGDLLLIEPNEEIQNNDLVLCIYGLHRLSLQRCSADCPYGSCVRIYSKNDKYIHLYSIENVFEPIVLKGFIKKFWFKISFILKEQPKFLRS